MVKCPKCETQMVPVSLMLPERPAYSLKLIKVQKTGFRCPKCGALRLKEKKSTEKGEFKQTLQKISAQ